MNPTLDFQGQTVVLTGGTRGIGGAIVDALVAAKAGRVISTGTSKEGVDRLNRAAREKGLTNLEYRQVDFLNEESTDAFLFFVGSLDRIDVCVNNAGTNRIALLSEVSRQDYDLLHKVNLRAPFLLTTAVAPIMRRRRYGRIVNIGSIWSSVTKAGRAVYASTKCGIVGLTKTSAIEFAADGVLVNAVSPGFTMTELTKSTLSAAEIDELSAAVPAGRFAEPHEIAAVVLFLASSLNTYLTGQNVIVDGGYVCV